MRKRTLRDLSTIFGVAVIIAGLVLLKSWSERGSYTKQRWAWREQVEKQRRNLGTELLSWDILRETKGTIYSGPKFHETLLALHGTVVNLVGFMVPLYEFRNAREFLVLPLPIECYFCGRPPMRDVVFVQMGGDQEVQVVNEPVLISGILTLSEGAGAKFFYVIKEARWGAAEVGGKLTQKITSPEHMAPAHLKQLDDETMYEGAEPPKPDSAATDSSTE